MIKQTFNFENNKGHFIFLDGMMEQRTGGKGDLLWLNGLALICYDNEDIKNMVVTCVSNFERYPGDESNDFSRDQLTSALVSMKINDIPIDFDIPKRISSKFRVTADMRAWINAIQGDKKAETLFLRYSNLIMFFALPYNRALYKVCNLKPLPPHEISEYRELTRGEKFATFAHYPAYALHLFAWQLACIPDSKLKRKVQKKCLRYIEKLDNSNYLLRILFGGYVSIEEITSYKPMTGIRWQCIFIKDQFNAVRIMDKETENHLDKDLLIFAYNNLR